MANSRIMLTCKHCGGQMVLAKGSLGSYHTVEENKAAQLNDFFEKHEKGQCSEEYSCSDNARDHFIILEEGESLDVLFGAWISTDEKLPKIDEQVLVCDECGDVYTDYRSLDGFWSKEISRRYGVSYLYWMPLPDAPQKEG